MPGACVDPMFMLNFSWENQEWACKICATKQQYEIVDHSLQALTYPIKFWTTVTIFEVSYTRQTFINSNLSSTAEKNSDHPSVLFSRALCFNSGLILRLVQCYEEMLRLLDSTASHQVLIMRPLTKEEMVVMDWVMQTKYVVWPRYLSSREISNIRARFLFYPLWGVNWSGLKVWPLPCGTPFCQISLDCKSIVQWNLHSVLNMFVTSCNIWWG